MILEGNIQRDVLFMIFIPETIFMTSDGTAIILFLISKNTSRHKTSMEFAPLSGGQE